jgi:hypothetical protein
VWPPSRRVFINAPIVHVWAAHVIGASHVHGAAQNRREKI